MGKIKDTMSKLEETRSRAERSKIMEQGRKIEADVEIMGSLVVEKVAETGERLKERIRK